MTVDFHFREPYIPNIIILISLILLLISFVFVKKDDKLKGAKLLIMGSIVAILWYFIDFFIPGILLPAIPTPEDLEFTRVYGIILIDLIPDLVLILSLGILPLVVFFMNRSSNSISFLALGAIIQIISIVVGIDQYNLLISVFSLTTTAISMAFFAYYGYIIKNFFLVLFALSFFIARLLFLLII
ncbi:MAG: hypothetical protein ACFFBH_16485 [Promethearchaeota archaeon]